MRHENLRIASAAFALIQLSSALPSQLIARQSIDFDLVDSTPDPVIKPDNTTNFNPAAAIASVIAEVKADPLPQTKRTLQARDIVVSTYPGYSVNQAIGNAAINAPLDCNQKDTYMGVKLFTSTAFDTALCAAACTAQSQYNVAHPPKDRPAQTCKFYNTYALYKNNDYQGQYCTLYNQTWAGSYATNTGQWRGNDHYTIQNSYIASNATDGGICTKPNAQPVPQVPADPPMDLTTWYPFTDPPNVMTATPNLITLTRPERNLAFIRHHFPTVPGTWYEITFDYFINAGLKSESSYFISAGGMSYAPTSILWSSSVNKVNFKEEESTDNTRNSASTLSCIRAQYQPRTPPAFGQWNTGKIALRTQSTRGYFYMASEGLGDMQWRNIYIRAKDDTYCSEATLGVDTQG